MLKEVFNSFNISINDFQLECFDKYYQFLIEENKKYNLTAITEKIDVYYKHFLDSVLPFAYFKPNSNVLDVGSGAGFPSIPLAILRSDINFTLIDSVNKKVNFLNQTINLLGLNNVKAIHTRCEDFANVSRETFDYVVARAVAPMNTLCEYLIPFARVDGEILMYKGNNYLEEMNQCDRVFKLFHVKHFKTLNYKINMPEEKLNKLSNMNIINEKLDIEKNIYSKPSENNNTSNIGPSKNVSRETLNQKGLSESILKDINQDNTIKKEGNNEILERNIVILKKFEKTDKKYPRSGNKPRLNPLK